MMPGMEQNLRTPGPTPIPQDVRDAEGQQMVDHRGSEFGERASEDLVRIVQLRRKQASGEAKRRRVVALLE